MKKIIFTLLTISLASIFNLLSAQSCGNSAPSICTATGGPIGGGFQHPDSVPCIVQGVDYDNPIQLTMFSVFHFAGDQTVDSIEFKSIENLPCGLCWSTNHANNRYNANEYGCINIKGKSDDAPGQYKLAFTLIAWINGNPNPVFPSGIPPTTVEAAGIKMFLRVQSQLGTCLPTDTSKNATNLTAATPCSTGINDLNNDLSSLNILPIPMNSSAVLSFMAIKSAVYTMRITDMAGRVVLLKEVEVRQGENKMVVERNNMNPGVYFLSLSDGKLFVTKRFSIIE